MHTHTQNVKKQVVPAEMPTAHHFKKVSAGKHVLSILNGPQGEGLPFPSVPVRRDLDASNPPLPRGVPPVYAFALFCVQPLPTPQSWWPGVKKCHHPALGADGSIPPVWLQLLHPHHICYRHEAAAMTDLPGETEENWGFT